MLWEQLGPEERTRLTTVHRQRYYQLANFLHHQDSKNPHEARAIARRELPNLLHAVDAAFAAQDPDAVDFSDSVTQFLNIFGLPREAERLIALSQNAAGEEGSRAWLMAQSNRGEQLFDAGRAAEAAALFRRVLDRLGDTPSYQRATALGRLGRCFGATGQPGQAAQYYREGIALGAELEPGDNVKRLIGLLHTDLAGVLAATGQYAEARKEYEVGLGIAENGKDLRQQGVILGQLGTLAMREGKLGEALEGYRAALALFKQLGEPAMEAVAWHQLGRVFQTAGRWEESEPYYREAARLREENGLIGGRNGAANTWNCLAIVSQQAGKPGAAEHWHRKAIDAARTLGDPLGLSRGLHNLADLLQHQTARLAEARELAEESLAIDKTLDPDAAQIWTTYIILADIAEKEAASTSDSRRQAALKLEARQHRRLAREHQRNFAGTRHALQRRRPLIVATLMAAQDPAKKALVEEALAVYSHASWNALCAAIRRIVAGERDEDSLQVGQFGDSPMIIVAILAALADPSALEGLVPPDGQGN